MDFLVSVRWGGLALAPFSASTHFLQVTQLPNAMDSQGACPLISVSPSQPGGIRCPFPAKHFGLGFWLWFHSFCLVLIYWITVLLTKFARNCLIISRPLSLLHVILASSTPLLFHFTRCASLASDLPDNGWVLRICLNISSCSIWPVHQNIPYCPGFMVVATWWLLLSRYQAPRLHFVRVLTADMHLLEYVLWWWGVPGPSLCPALAQPLDNVQQSPIKWWQVEYLYILLEFCCTFSFSKCCLSLYFHWYTHPSHQPVENSAPSWWQEFSGVHVHVHVLNWADSHRMILMETSSFCPGLYIPSQFTLVNSSVLSHIGQKQQYTKTTRLVQDPSHFHLSFFYFKFLGPTFLLSFSSIRSRTPLELAIIT